VKVVDIIAEYLGQLFKHTKTRLTAFHGLRENSHVELVLCVPTSWTDKACRVMQEALATAIQTSQLTKLNNGIIDDLFIVAESEAAATYAIEDHESSFKMITDEPFLLLDCGGGTVDAITYKLTRTTPARMEEVIAPEGISCGSSFLNGNYENLLQQRLRHAKFVGNDLPLERIIAVEVQKFENEKRSINILDKKAHIDSVHIQGLQAEADEKLRIRKNKLDISRKEMMGVFRDCLRGVEELMLKQLNAAKMKNVNVQTVILTGGFGESPSLRNHLKKMLRKERNMLNQPIDLHPSRYVQSAVARGAVLRALRKDFGPRRITRSSYGILQSEPYDETSARHRKFRVDKHPADGELYIMDTINWVIEKVCWYNPRMETVSNRPRLGHSH
jgi:molecular chaperone DnaK (HSP70)